MSEHSYALSTPWRMAILCLLWAARIADPDVGGIPELAVHLTVDALLIVAGWWALSPMESRYGKEFGQPRSWTFLMTLIPAAGLLMLIRDILPLVAGSSR